MTIYFSVWNEISRRTRETWRACCWQRIRWIRLKVKKTNVKKRWPWTVTIISMIERTSSRGKKLWIRVIKTCVFLGSQIFKNKKKKGKKMTKMYCSTVKWLLWIHLLRCILEVNRWKRKSRKWRQWLAWKWIGFEVGCFKSVEKKKKIRTDVREFIYLFQCSWQSLNSNLYDNDGNWVPKNADKSRKN